MSVPSLGVLVTVITTLVIVVRWVYRQGAANQKMLMAIDGNTHATNKLTAAYEKSTEKTKGTLLDHEKRLTRVEDKLTTIP